MRNKKKLIIILTILVLLIVVCVSSYFIYIKVNGEAKYLKIKLNGGKEITINYKDEYKDKGAKAFYKNKDITKNIKTKTDINLEKIGTYSYTYTIKYKKQTKSIKRIINIIDKEAPVLELNGKEEITLYKGNEYKEEGAKATDNYDGDITDKIEISGEVDKDKIGEYTITYKVVDSSNNESSIERKVKVIEKPQTNNSTTNYGSPKTGKTSKGYNIEYKDGVYYVDGILIANKSYALSSNYNPGGLLSVFTDNFNKMQSDAANEGINLKIISGYRSYSNQQGTYQYWVSQYGRSKADTVSARPGHSEHQSGLAADINDLGQGWANTTEGKWLNNNCYKYGFIIRYPKGKEGITGYIFEPWHIRYVGNDLASKLYNGGDWITLEEYFGIDSKY